MKLILAAAAPSLLGRAGGEAVVILSYFLLLLAISHLTARRSNNNVFFRGEKKSPWYLVAFGMVGASISGITFISVPGMVLHSGMTYLQMCMGFIFGYLAVAFILLPIYYRLNLTTIYTYLRTINDSAYKTGASFFILSKLLGSAAKFYVPCYIISNTLGWNFAMTIVFLLVLIWLYTRKGGIKTLVWTDTLQTTSILLALLLIIYKVGDGCLAMGDGAMTVGGLWNAVMESPMSTVFNFSDAAAPNYFWKSFLSGVFIVIVMTGLDQDMMQKNLTCRSLRDAQKDMCTYGLAFVPVNALFLFLGVLLAMYYTQHGMPLPEKADDLLCQFAIGGEGFGEGLGGPLVMIFFTVGILASSFSTIDSALTALTTSCCVDILGIKHGESECEDMKGERTRKLVHVLMTLALIACVLLFDAVNTSSLIDAVYTLVSYTYGPLLGLFLFAIMSGGKRKASSIGVPLACISAPLICLAIDHYVPLLTGYRFGYELLIINGLLTYIGLSCVSKDVCSYCITPQS